MSMQAPQRHEPRLARLVLSVVPFVGSIGLAVSALIHFTADGTDQWQRWMVENAIFWLVGIAGFVLGSGHIVMPDRVAGSIGWPKGNPFQFEVGLASISYGAIGVFATSHGPEWWLATIIAFSVFMLGAAAGHVREMVARRNFSPGNAGTIFVYDLVVPIFLIVLYLLYRGAA